MKSLAVVSKKFLGMARQRDTAELNLNANKCTLLSLTPSSLQKDGGEPPVDSAPQVVPPPNPSTSTARGLLEEIDLTGNDKNTLTEDFQVGNHVSFFSFPLVISSGARSALPMGVAPESMFDCM